MVLGGLGINTWFDTWLPVITTFAGGAFVAVLGNLLIPWFREYRRRPKLKLSLHDDWVLSQNKQVIYHRLQVANKGGTVAHGCVATIKVKNATKENILEETKHFKAILKPENFGVKPVLEDLQWLCWSFGSNPTILNLNPDIPYMIDVLAFDYGQQVDPKNLPTVQGIVIPSEIGWNAPRVILKPSRYVFWVKVHGANCKPSNEVQFWVRRIAGVNDNHLEVSFTP